MTSFSMPSFIIAETDNVMKPLPTQIERRTRSYLSTYPSHDGTFYDRLKLADRYIQAREDDGEDVRAYRDQLTDIFVTRDSETLAAFIRNVARIKN